MADTPQTSSYHKEQGVVELSDAERAAMTSLYNGAAALLSELARMVARSRGVEVSAHSALSQVQFFTQQSLRQAESTASTSPAEISARAAGQIKITLLDDNGNCVGVYEDPPGICRGC